MYRRCAKHACLKIGKHREKDIIVSAPHVAALASPGVARAVRQLPNFDVRVLFLCLAASRAASDAVSAIFATYCFERQRIPSA